MKGRVRHALFVVLATFSPLGLAVSPALADIGESIGSTPIRDDFSRYEVPLATGEFTKPSWPVAIGGAWGDGTGAWHGYGTDSAGHQSGAYWNQATFDDEGGPVTVAATVGTGSYPSGQYVGLWLDMPNPGKAHSGYEARFSGTGTTNTYEAEISKWVSGTRTVLASEEDVSLPLDTTFALTESSGGSIALWSGSGTSFSSILSATDTTYSSGYAGIEVLGGSGTYYDFRAGNIDTQPPETTITSGPSGATLPDVAFTFTSSESGSTFECALDEGSYGSCTSPRSYQELSEGAHAFNVRAKDGAGNVDATPAERAFEVVQPPDTTITSPTPTYTSHEEPAIGFSSSEPGVSFKCSLDDLEDQPKTACASPYALPEHLSSGWHTFVVAAVSEAGVMDPTPAAWTFNTGSYPTLSESSAGKLVYPEDGKKTTSYYTLKAEWGEAPEGGGVTGVTFQMELPKSEVFEDVPEECTLDGEGHQASWPLPVTSSPGHSDPVFLDAKGCAQFEGVGGLEESVKFRAVFDGGKNAAGASEAASTELIRVYNTSRITTDAAESVGPATLDLLTGDITISRTDVSIPVPGTEANLEFTRTYDSTIENNLTGFSTVLGSWWQPSAPVEAEYEGEAWARLKEQVIPATPAVSEKECWNEEGEIVSCGAECNPEFCEEWIVQEAQPEQRWMELFDNEGGSIPFEISGETYVSPDYAKELKLTREDSEHVVLSDPNGTHTTFTQNGSGSREYLPGVVSFQASPSSQRLIYENVGHNEGLRLMRIVAPAPEGVTCGDWTSLETAGCRTLRLEYLPKNEWAASHEAYNEWEVALASIRYYNASGSKETSQVVAKYNYGGYLELTEEWDPRLPNLKEKYGYKVVSSGRLTSLTPPGEEPWEFEYEYKTGCCTGESRLKSVSRASLLQSEPTATTTVAYDVPLSGEGAPYDMSPESVAEWGQMDFPVDATAIFPPNHEPGEYPPSDYSGATVHYMDPDGHEVNTASPSVPGVEGDSIATSETDVHGNVVRALGAQARLDALEAEDPATRSHELDSHSIYNEDGTRMLESWGPLHEVRRENGETIEARAHTTIEYDQGFDHKEGETWPNVPTKETVAAVVPGQKGELEPRVSETHYDWTLRRPTEGVTDPDGLDIVTKTVYNSAGQVSEQRQPSNAEGGGAGSTKTDY